MTRQDPAESLYDLIAYCSCGGHRLFAPGVAFCDSPRCSDPPLPITTSQFELLRERWPLWCTSRRNPPSGE